MKKILKVFLLLILTIDINAEIIKNNTTSESVWEAENEYLIHEEYEDDMAEMSRAVEMTTEIPIALEDTLDEKKEYTTIKSYEKNKEPVFNIKYTGSDLPGSLRYAIVRSNRINLREKPTTASQILGKANYGERLKVLEKVETNDGKIWYKISKKDKEYFVYSKIVLLREFRFELMEDKLIQLDDFVTNNINRGLTIASVEAYRANKKVENYKRNKDKYGNVADQSAIGKYDGERVYVEDRTIVAIEEEGKSSYKVKKIGGEEPYLYIGKRSITKEPNIEEMPRKAIIIDIKNQNFGVYEKNNDGIWEVVSYSYSKTGRISGLGFETPKGNFIVPMAKKKMIYTNKEGEHQGYAANAIRFSGGGYIHGTPFNYDELDNYESIRRSREARLGTYSGTRKCVRNTVEHSKFLFNWVVGSEVRKGNIQKPKENVVVIVI